MSVLPFLHLCVVLGQSPRLASEQDRFPLPVDPQRGTAFAFRPSEESALFLFELHGVPVGTVSLRWDRSSGRYEYRSRHLFARAQDRTWVVRTGGFFVDERFRIKNQEAYPEALWVWRKPASPGCVRLKDELGAKTGEGCAERVSENEVTGRLFGEPYAAHYEQGWLSRLDVGGARFRAVPFGTEPSSQDVFAAGFPIGGKGQGSLVSRPVLRNKAAVNQVERSLSVWNEAAAIALSAEVHAQFTRKTPSAADLRSTPPDDWDAEGSCLSHAKRYVRRARDLGHEVALVLGLWAEEDGVRAFPHAWVRVRTASSRWLDLDPTFELAVQPRTHLPLHVQAKDDPDESAAGKLWLDLLAGRIQVARAR